MTETSGFPVRSAIRTFLGKQTADMKRRVPGGSERVLFNASLQIVHLTIPAGQGEVGHVDKNAFRQIFHGFGHSLNDTSVKSHQIVQFLSCLLSYAGRLPLLHSVLR